MTGLLRTTIFFFLPIFAALLCYEIWVATRPTPDELRQEFLEKHATAVESVKAVTEKLLADGTTGRVPMPAEVSDQKVILADVTVASESILTLVDPQLIAASSWTMVPSSTEGKTYDDRYRFTIQAIEKSDSDPKVTSHEPFEVIFAEETIYLPDGNPAHLNLYIQPSPLAK
tara:strand:- start:1535 stop:2050 length:516 start_codon:yes stop_codon:yes gene_type:complete